MAGEEARASAGSESDERLTFWQRRALKDLVKYARKQPGEPLTQSDWEAYWRFGSQPTSRVVKRIMRALPSTPRCGFCGAPFAGFGSHLVRPLGYRASRKNPSLCATCIELTPPGGMTMEVGVLFADLRGFTAQSESMTPAEAGAELRRFYAHAEKVFLPEAIIDKLIGDEVMALYLPIFFGAGPGGVDHDARRRIATVMLEHARDLLERVGYGCSDGPAFEVGIGLDYGEAFIGNIGNAAVRDFTAVGDVVNTASRLQGHAAAGDILLSARLAALLENPVGVPESLVLKGKQEPVEAVRVQPVADPPRA